MSEIESNTKSFNNRGWRSTLLPRSLFGRALLIIVLPVLFVQLFSAYFFYERHWASVTRNMSQSLTGDIALLVNETHHASDRKREEWRALAKHVLSMTVTFHYGDVLNQSAIMHDQRFLKFHQSLKQRIGLPTHITLNDDGSMIDIAVELHDSVMHVAVSKKRLFNSTSYIFSIWLAVSSLLVLLVAVLFLRNQMRPIGQLAQAAERFGLGDDEGDFRPRGATEVRQAGRAFLTMRARIRRQVATRTAMLAGISHDLRTPLTRMKLEIAMLKDEEMKSSLSDDVDEMQHMIQEYLDYAKGDESSELRQEVILSDYLADMIPHYNHTKNRVSLEDADVAIHVTIAPRAFRRVVDNIITNALRYGGDVCRISTVSERQHALIIFDDEGEGIPESLQEEVFRPFTRLEGSRNAETGGVGLGLSIAQDIVQSHGGTIRLINRELGGLRVMVRIPRKL